MQLECRLGKSIAGHFGAEGYYLEIVCLTKGELSYEKSAQAAYRESPKSNHLPARRGVQDLI